MITTPLETNVENNTLCDPSSRKIPDTLGKESGDDEHDYYHGMGESTSISSSSLSCLSSKKSCELRSSSNNCSSDHKIPAIIPSSSSSSFSWPASPISSDAQCFPLTRLEARLVARYLGLGWVVQVAILVIYNSYRNYSIQDDDKNRKSTALVRYNTSDFYHYYASFCYHFFCYYYHKQNLDPSEIKESASSVGTPMDEPMEEQRRSVMNVLRYKNENDFFFVVNNDEEDDDNEEKVDAVFCSSGEPQEQGRFDESNESSSSHSSSGSSHSDDEEYGYDETGLVIEPFREDEAISLSSGYNTDDCPDMECYTIPEEDEEALFQELSKDEDDGEQQNVVVLLTNEDESPEQQQDVEEKDDDGSSSSSSSSSSSWFGWREAQERGEGSDTEFTPMVTNSHCGSSTSPSLSSHENMNHSTVKSAKSLLVGDGCGLSLPTQVIFDNATTATTGLLDSPSSWWNDRDHHDYAYGGEKGATDYEDDNDSLGALLPSPPLEETDHSDGSLQLFVRKSSDSSDDSYHSPTRLLSQSSLLTGSMEDIGKELAMQRERSFFLSRAQPTSSSVEDVLSIPEIPYDDEDENGDGGIRLKQQALVMVELLRHPEKVTLLQMKHFVWWLMVLWTARNAVLLLQQGQGVQTLSTKITEGAWYMSVWILQHK